MEVFIGRQPIFNGFDQVQSYELLYRSGSESNRFPTIDADLATVDVIVNSLFSIGMDVLSNGKPCFINFTENLLMSDIFDHLNPVQFVIEILEDIPITKSLIRRLKELKAKGYRIALDDFVLHDFSATYEELFTYIDIIKVDFLNTKKEDRQKIEMLVKRKFPHITLLAEKVETREEYEKALKKGYKLFQGYYFMQPQIIKGQDVPANLLHYYQVIALLRAEEPDINQISENIEHDIALSYKLLQLINSSAKRTKSKIRSIKQAILLLGLDDLKRWVYILIYRESQKFNTGGTFDELMKTSLVRAKTCELLAKHTRKKNMSEYFLIGMFSLIDAILQRPIHTILQHMPLTDEVAETICGGDTDMQPFLQLAIAIERMHLEQVSVLADDLEIPYDSIVSISKASAKWVNTIC